MGQIFSRIGRIAKAYSREAEHTLQNPLQRDRDGLFSLENDDERRLREEIDALSHMQYSQEQVKSHTMAGNHSQTTSQGVSEQNSSQYTAALELLGVRHSDSDDIIKNVYRSKIRALHPDTVGNDSPEIQQKASRLAAELNAAFQVIQDVRKM
jgi:DnaJ-domain-containing protein 1